MPDPAIAFTTRELRRLLAIELTRADTSFQRTQIEARAAMAQDLVPGSERIAVLPLELDRLDLAFALVQVPLPWWRRAWRGVRRLFLGPQPEAGPRFRFAAQGEAGVQMTCTVRRDARGRFRAETEAA